MAEATKTFLAELLEERGMGAAYLARQLGVSRVAVHLWASGKERLPGHRAREVAFYLDLTEAETERLESEATKGQVRQSSAEPSTFLDWLVRWEASAHLGATYGERVETMAAYAGVPVSEAARWLRGEKRVPLAVGAALFSDSGAWRSLSLRALADALELGTPVSEYEALDSALADIGADNLVGVSWDSAVARLLAAKAAWEADPTSPVEAALLPRQEAPYPDFYSEKALSFGERRRG